MEDRKNGWDFKEDAIEKVIKFIHKLRHFTGKHNGKPFKLEPWQAFIIANLYGFYNKDGSRRFQTAYLEMARKQGKTALAGAQGIYHLKADGEANAQVLIAANSKEQAKIDIDMVLGFVELLDPRETIYKRFRNDIILNRERGFIKILAADANTTDGYDCSVGIIDEYHSAPNNNIRNSLQSSMGVRVNPLLETITTAGFDKSLPCYELRMVASEVAAGIKKDESMFGLIFAPDENDDWKDPQTWIKSNPNLGVTVTKNYIQQQVQKAFNSPNEEVGVKTKNLNIWCDSATVWIPDSYIISATKKLNMDDFIGQECFVGVDLAVDTDLTAISYLFFRDDKYYFFVDYYLPRETLEKRVHADNELYKHWAGNKYIKITSGNVTDYDYLTADLLKINDKCGIKTIYYDKFNATSWAIQCTGAGLKMEPFSQQVGHFNNPTKNFSRLILRGDVVLDDNPVTRYCFRNVEIKRDMHDNQKPIKKDEKRKIDGVIAILQAFAAQIDDSANYKGTAIY
jgi:phage terminase large subunit-like protein